MSHDRCPYINFDFHIRSSFGTLLHWSGWLVPLALRMRKTAGCGSGWVDETMTSGVANSCSRLVVGGTFMASFTSVFAVTRGTACQQLAVSLFKRSSPVMTLFSNFSFLPSWTAECSPPWGSLWAQKMHINTLLWPIRNHYGVYKLDMMFHLQHNVQLRVFNVCSVQFKPIPVRWWWFVEKRIDWMMD